MHDVRRLGGAALLAAAVTLTACGTDDHPTADDRSTATATPSATAPPAPSGPGASASTTTAAQHSAPPTAGAVAAPPAVDPFAETPLIDHLEWTDDPDGPRLHIYPSPAGRGDDFAPAVDRAWGEVVAAAPNADSAGMYDQFKCHWEWARLVAPNKPTWNIEPWRPAPGYQGTVAAMCNPGGPDTAGN